MSDHQEPRHPGVTTPFHHCGCGWRVGDREEWRALPDRKTLVNNEGDLIEHRRCPACGSTMTVALLPALSAEELRRAVRIVDSMSESFNRQYTALELMFLVRACWLSEWDITPDCWTPQQVARALLDGEVPRFESDGDHAVGVTDCPCRSCKSGKAATEPAPGIEEEPIGCWRTGCYLAVDNDGKCPVHGGMPF